MSEHAERAAIPAGLSPPPDSHVRRSGPTAFPRGFLLTSTDGPIQRLASHLPSWQCQPLAAGWHVAVHPAPTPGVVQLAMEGSVLLLGHAYDPWTGLSGPDALTALAETIPRGRHPTGEDTELWNALDRLSGRFVLGVLDPVAPWFVQDAVGLQTLYYVAGGDGFVASSHSQLLAEVMGLARDPMVDELVSSGFYRIGVRHLPGLTTPFRGMKMLSANTWLDVKGDRPVRFFPREPHGPVQDWDLLVAECASVMATSVEMLARDHDLAVSLSLGTDSRTTLAACRGVADQLVFFSYGSNPAERHDAEGAGRLCEKLGLTWEHYPVDVEGYRSAPDPEFEALLSRNSAGIRLPKVTEIAKLKTLVQAFPPGRMELKTPVSEIGRAIYCKKMGVASLPERLTTRDMSNLYKRNALNRRLLGWMDTAFRDFRERTAFGVSFHDYEEHDLFYWEHRNSQWAALANQDHDIVHDMTTIFNNRRLLVNFLKPSRPDRIADRLHRDIIRHLWPEVLQLPLAVKSGPRARLRQAAERWFFRINAWPDRPTPAPR